MCISHVTCYLGRPIRVQDLIAELKRESSKWLNEQSPSLSEFYWQSGYGVFSVSKNHIGALLDYIDDQEAHYAKKSFQEEYRRILKLHEIEFDERYVWD
jgi:putative transposase